MISDGWLLLIFSLMLGGCIFLLRHPSHPSEIWGVNLQLDIFTFGSAVMVVGSVYGLIFGRLEACHR